MKVKYYEPNNHMTGIPPVIGHKNVVDFLHTVDSICGYHPHYTVDIKRSDVKSLEILDKGGNPLPWRHTGLHPSNHDEVKGWGHPGMVILNGIEYPV